MADSTSSTQESCQERVKNSLQGWREIVAASYNVFIWKESYYPVAIAGAVTTLFLLIWTLEPSVLTTISLIGALISLLDYFVPSLSNSYFDVSKWNESKEATFDLVCKELASSYLCLVSAVSTAKQYKDESPKVYLGGLLLSLLTLAWIGNLLNNLFLVYLLVLFITLYPGLKHHGIIQRYTGLAYGTVRSLLAGHLPAALGGGPPATQGGDRKNK